MTEITVPTIDWLPLLPGLTVTVTAVLVLLWDLWMREEERTLLAWLSLLGLGVAAIFSPILWGRSVNAFNGTLALDNYALFLNLLLCPAAGLTILMSVNYLEGSEIRRGEYYSLILFATLGMMIMAAATDLIVIFLGLETMSIAVYVLAGIWRQQPRSTEAALKYFLLGAFASGFLLYGIALVYGATGSTQLARVAEYIAAEGVSPLLLAGVAMLFVGFGFKVAAAPFHVWTPDVYQGSPTTVTAFMAVGVKAAAFAAFARVFMDSLGGIHAEWESVMWVLAVLTMTIGNVTAIVQSNIKRMLAYSSIAHAGYLLIAIVAANELAGAALLYYLVAYALMNLGAFGVVMAVGHKGEANEEIADYAGLGFRYPALGAAMAVFLLSLTGVPPLVGFTGKFYIFGAAVQAGYIGLAVIGVLNSVVSAYYYIGVIVTMYMQEGDKEIGVLSARPYLALAIIITALGTVLMGIFPGPYMVLAKGSFLSLG